MSRPRIPAAAWWLGAVSFVNDAASEMVLPLLPALMVGSLGLPAASIGAIEGVASAVASGLKLAFGRLGDRTGKHRALMVGGYAVSNLVRPLMALATGGLGVAVLRVADRVGKGLRTAPRDALLAASTPREAQAAAFSVHRGLDHAGTILGAAAAALLLRYGGFSPAEVFGWSAVPGVLVVVLAILAVRSPALVAPPPAPVAVVPDPRPGRGFSPLLGIIALSRLGLASEMFLLLLAGRFVEPWQVPLLWCLLHLVKATASFLVVPLGTQLSARSLVALGWAAHSVVFLGFAGAAVRWHGAFVEGAGSVPSAAVVAVVGLFAAWGLQAGLSEGAEKSLVAAASPDNERGTAFGAYHMVTGLMALPASAGFGALWDATSPGVAFAAGAGTAGLAALLLWLWPGAVRR